jgi:hypothetical protein
MGAIDWIRSCARRTTRYRYEPGPDDPWPAVGGMIQADP